ncbi:uncharacterized protein LOC130748096 isoform X2 [Lotus japonicus]|uniref:uncharacterized protein LOC130748096 isoform X2 n=1 Tax=Lotus japonicus TaxID=34305 RepID=UPI00258EC7AE|nr:uncharacterized protein LOC130748096 isoform X2 [Lotus japonicus]
MMPSAATLLYALLFPLLYALLDPLLLLPCRVCSSSTTFSFSTAFCSYPSISYALSSTLLVPMDITLQMHFEHDGGAGAEGGAASSRLHSEDSEGVSYYLFLFMLHDRAQVFICCPSKESGSRPTYVGTVERKRYSNYKLSLPGLKCHSKSNLFILGILSSVYLDGEIVQGWKRIPVPLLTTPSSNLHILH